MQDYDMMIMEKAQVVFMEMEKRVPAEDVERIRAAFELAREAHAAQKRKSGDPYIIHPIAVATIVAIELKLGANPVIAAFLHDVVEDTAYTIDDIRQRFGDDVAFLVSVVTKKSTGNYEISKQVDNYKQMLNSIHYDIRALLVKLADRLHNMRTLSSMRPDKQMKIAGETDFFYAPLANRLGLYNVKIELENLSFRYRCPHEYELITSLIQKDQESHQERLDIFTARIREALANDGIKVLVRTIYRAPYSIWRKMRKSGDLLPADRCLQRKARRHYQLHRLAEREWLPVIPCAAAQRLRLLGRGAYQQRANGTCLAAWSCGGTQRG